MTTIRVKLAAMLAGCACLAGAMPSVGATGTLSLSAVVLSASNCKFQAGSATLLDFGGVDPSSLANKTANATMVVRCNGSAATATFVVNSGDGLFGLGPGQPRMRHTVNNAEFLPYSLNTPYSASVPKGVNTNVVIVGTITPAQFQNALGGDFADLVLLTLMP